MLLHLNEGVAVHSVWRPDSVLTGGVWDAFLALPPLLGRPLERVAILGNAGGTTARALGVYYPDAQIDGVELDPAVSRVGSPVLRHGRQPAARRCTTRTRGRSCARRDERYDLIVVDAYRQPYVPFYLATREFFRLVREHLTPGGIVALNVATVPDDKRLVAGGRRHARRRLPAGPRVARASLQHDRPRADRAARRRRARARGSRPGRATSRRSASCSRATRGPSSVASRPWTDDRAPVEWLTDRMIVSYAAEGGRLEEDYLPTRPTP